MGCCALAKKEDNKNKQLKKKTVRFDSKVILLEENKKKEVIKKTFEAYDKDNDGYLDYK